MPLMVRNNERNTTVFAKEVNGNPLRITWRAKGDRSGLDVQRVPDYLAEDVDFLDNLDLGVLEVIGGPEHILAKINEAKRDVEALRAKRQEVDAQHTAALDRSANRDIISKSCLECGTQVLIRASDLKEVPPLCTRHSHMSDQFYLAEEGSRGEGATEDREGKVTHEWKRAAIGPRVRA